MLKIRIRKWNGKCRKHPRYDPAAGGRGAVKGGCVHCGVLCDIYEQHLTLTAMIERARRDFPQTRERRPRAPREVQFDLFSTTP